MTHDDDAAHVEVGGDAASVDGGDATQHAVRVGVAFLGEQPARRLRTQAAGREAEGATVEAALRRGGTAGGRTHRLGEVKVEMGEFLCRVLHTPPLKEHAHNTQD